MAGIAEPASFRDPAGRVFASGGRVFRELTPRGEDLWRDLGSAGFLPELESRGLVVGTSESREPGAAGGLVLEHERVPLLSYPYEWPPSLLREAALLHLRLLEDLIPRGFILKDATPFNVLFRGVRPVFIDLLSIERRADGDPWAAYGQFCETMLYPLLLQAHKGIPYHAWLRGSHNGIPPELFAPLFGWRDWLRPGVLAHVTLRAALHRSFRDPRGARRAEIQEAGLPAEALLRNIRNLRTLIEGLALDPAEPGRWASYGDGDSYGPKASAEKAAFAERLLGELRPGLVWDIGCNTGRFSRLAASSAGLVIGFDSDAGCVELLARRCLAGGPPNLLPLVMDFADPSPDLGWACEERRSIFRRERPDLVIALAVSHHLEVAGGVPLERQLDLLARTAGHALFEFVSPEDPLFQAMRADIRGGRPPCGEEEFERLLGSRFAVLASADLTPSRRVYALRSKAAARS